MAGGMAVAVQFFISGLRLPSSTALQGLKAWRLHLVIVVFSFGFFPLLGFGVAAGSSWYLTHELAAGLLFLTMLPTAVQTATTFTGIAGGNSAAAVCAASISNLLGVVVTPLLVALALGSYSGMNVSSAGRIALQIVAPFVLGQLLHKLTARWTQRWMSPLKMVDRGAILLVVYTAFGAAVADGLWQKLPPAQLAVTAGICALMRHLAGGQEAWFPSCRCHGPHVLRLGEKPGNRPSAVRDTFPGTSWGSGDPACDYVPRHAVDRLRGCCTSRRQAPKREDRGCQGACVGLMSSRTKTRARQPALTNARNPTQDGPASTVPDHIVPRVVEAVLGVVTTRTRMS
jgi:predicted Na+-dependent transporter